MQYIILSGGSGKRLWPLSNDVRSKQFLKMLPGEAGEPQKYTGIRHIIHIQKLPECLPGPPTDHLIRPGQLSLMEAARKLMFLGSSCIYPKMAPQPMKESCLLTSELEETNEAYAYIRRPAPPAPPAP